MRSTRPSWTGAVPMFRYVILGLLAASSILVAADDAAAHKVSNSGCRGWSQANRHAAIFLDFRHDVTSDAYVYVRTKTCGDSQGKAVREIIEVRKELRKWNGSRWTLCRSHTFTPRFNSSGGQDYWRKFTTCGAGTYQSWTSVRLLHNRAWLHWRTVKSRSHKF
jgi:hypothetical protein